VTITATGGLPREGLGWSTLSRATQLYIAAVIAGGASLLITHFPRTFAQPVLFGLLLLLALLTSLWKVWLLIPLGSGSTLSVSYAANLTALLLLGPREALLIAVAGVWAQCRFKVKGRYPLYRTIFSMADAAITMVATGYAYAALGGPTRPLDLSVLAKPLLGAIGTYFVVNTTLIAGAIALSTGRRIWDVWSHDFLWSGASFIVAGTAGAAAAVVIDRGWHWNAVLMLAPVYLTYRTYLLLVGRIEDQKRQEHALSEEKDRAEEANRVKDQFLALVSHELRTPLNAILGWSDMLCSGRLDAAQHDRACRAIYNSAKRQAQLVDELLDVARIMSGKLRVERAVVQLADVVRAAVETLQPTAEVKRVDVTFEMDPGIGAIEGDGARLQQVAWNLLSNAVKFTPPGGSVHVDLRRIGNVAQLTVTDTGEGIPSDFLPAVFEPFKQADGSSTRPHGGLGLGLSIVKYLVEAHGGTVTAASGGRERGATFTVFLPMLPPRPAYQHAAEIATSQHDPAASLAGLSVLVVDDDDESRQVVAAHLERSHAVVLAAASAAQALEVLQRERVDVLLADVAMPGEDGYALVRKLRASPSVRAASIPAIAVTAFARQEDRLQALQAGFQVHLAKPIDPRALVDAVASLGKLHVPSQGLIT
jgi:signal transduction histidine kinase/ActR/RegA family two-component response regulator